MKTRWKSGAIFAQTGLGRILFLHCHIDPIPTFNFPDSRYSNSWHPHLVISYFPTIELTFSSHNTTNRIGICGSLLST